MVLAVVDEELISWLFHGLRFLVRGLKLRLSSNHNGLSASH